MSQTPGVQLMWATNQRCKCLTETPKWRETR